MENDLLEVLELLDLGGDLRYLVVDHLQARQRRQQKHLFDGRAWFVWDSGFGLDLGFGAWVGSDLDGDAFQPELVQHQVARLARGVNPLDVVEHHLVKVQGQRFGD